ncbi:SUMF1/EgtB/PvdO family nonheme iron enzyme [Desulfococcaceae bacterium HSG8]|nr:SUMF1/EgtB/PvdO family nonheme iron enzyme [Desulfococcaceae bacterium HSG8]
MTETDKKLAQLKAAYESGILDEDTYISLKNLAVENREKPDAIKDSRIGILGDHARLEGDIHHGDRFGIETGRDAAVAKDHRTASVSKDTNIRARDIQSANVADKIDNLTQNRGNIVYAKNGATVIMGEHLKDKPDLSFEIREYCKKAESLHYTIPLAGFKTRLRVPIRIEDIYVPLRAVADMRSTGQSCFGDAEDAEKHLRECGESREIPLPEAFHMADKIGRRGIVILGDPGSGKTTHLKRLLLWCFRGGLEKLGLPENMIPVFLPLRELKDLSGGLDAFIQDQLNQRHLKTPEGFGERMLARGNLLLLFDGLDEVADPDHRARVSRWIEEALPLYDTCYFVVTCRFAGYSDKVQLEARFLEMHIRPMDEKQAQEFVHNWYRIVETGIRGDEKQANTIAEQEAEKLIRRLRRPEFRARRVFELTRNPLLLTNLCLVHRDRGNLPRSRARLYEECTDVLLELWRDAIGYESKINAQTGSRILQPAALWLHQEEGRTRARADELGPVIEPALKAVSWPHGTARDFLEVVRNESGLLTGWDQENYGFMHLGFQEYLAAREIRRKAFTDPSVLRELARRFGESWWQEVGLILLALEDPSLFVPYMREIVKLPGFTEHPDLVEMCLDDAAETSTEPFTELLEKDPGDDRELWKRQLMALRIAERLDPSVIGSLEPLMKDHPYKDIRQWFGEQGRQAGQDVIRAEPGGYELVRIPGGSFMMGSPDTEGGRYKNEGPLHKVSVSDFYMGRYPVTNEEYGRFLEANPDAEEPEYWSDRQYNQSRQPVVGVSWHDAKQYAEWAGLQLPSEAQWEYACRAGTQTRYYTGDSEDDLGRAGWYRENSGGQHHPVGKKEPNAFGLYDMHGNVWEWCEDWHGDYLPDAVKDTEGPDQVSSRVLRGGGWNRFARDCRSARRYGSSPGARSGRYGFRLAFSPGQQVS